jgi:hypothetical protein
MSMTTELAQRMKAAAEKLDGDSWHDEGASVFGGAYDVGDTVCYDHIVDCESVNGESLVAEFIALANPANVLALVEALEARDEQIAELTEARDLFNSKMMGFAYRVEELEAKLETADKLQDSAFRHGIQHGFSLGQTDNQAGFEQCLAAYSQKEKSNGC